MKWRALGGFDVRFLMDVGYYTAHVSCWPLAGMPNEPPGHRPYHGYCISIVDA